MPIPTTSAPVSRALLRDEVFARLRDAIVDGSFTPGEQLRDLELADWLGVSRTPVREALLRLAAAGLVQASPGRSTTVATLDLRAARDARDVVASMHRLAVVEAAAALTRGDLAEMRAANRRFRAALRAGDVDAALAADDDLHAVPVRAAANAALTAVLDQYTPVVRRAERARFSTLAGRASAARHDELVRLLASGADEDAAALAFDTFHSLDPDPDHDPDDDPDHEEP